MILRPMKATTVEIETMDKVEWPAYCSPKIDGIRLLIHPELGPVTQSFKPLPNVYVREKLLALCGGSYLDGELYAVDDDGTALFNRTQSAVMSRGGQPSFRFAAFDCFEHPEWEFGSRYAMTRDVISMIGSPRVRLLTHTLLGTVEEFISYADACIEDGFEGAVIRSLAGEYKSGRSTLNQGWMLKYKKWADAEGAVIGFEELHHNANEDVRDNFDLAKRSSSKDGLIPGGVLGALILSTAWGDLRVGTGFDHATRKAIWERNFPCNEATAYILGKQPDLGRRVTFKYQKHGMQALPRFPVFKGFRDD